MWSGGQQAGSIGLLASAPGPSVRVVRFLHTSDWHLGRTLHRADLQAAHEAVLAHLVEVVVAEAVDVVLVAGDVFDRAIPPVESVRLYERTLAALRAAGARVVVSSGNQDSPARLGMAASLIDASGVHVRTGLGRLLEPVVLRDGHGPVACYALPYLEPATAAEPLAELAGVAESLPRRHSAVLREATGLVAAHARAQGYERTVVLAHAWVAGGEPCDSERDITATPSRARPSDDPDPPDRVGTLDRVPVEAFTPFSYAALGHLHGRQRLAEGIRYSGSPLAYSFSEAQHVKGSWLVDLDATGLAEVRWVDAPVPRRLSRLAGRLADLLSGPEHDAVADDYLAVTLTDPAQPVDAMPRLRARFPHVLHLAWEPEGALPMAGSSYRARVRGRDDLDVAVDFVGHVRGTEATAAERALLAEALVAGARAEPADVAGAT